MIRWKFVLPRLALIGALLLLLTFGSGPALHWILIQSGQTATGAKVDIDSLKLSWSSGTIRLQGIAVADPKSPFKNALEAKDAQLDVDVSQLLRKRFVIEKATLTDLAFDQPREDSGLLETSAPPSDESFTESPWLKTAEGMASEQLQHWLQELKHIGIDQLENQFETVQVAQELSERWPREYAQMQVRVARLETQFSQLRNLAEEPNKNPLRMAQLVSTASKDVQRSIQEIDSLYREVQRLKQQIPQDKQRLLAAKKHDQEKIKQLVKAPEIKGEDITRSLFGNEQSEQIQTVLTWVQWVRGVVPNPDKDFQPTRSRGVDVRFTRDKQYPALWIREAAVSGYAPLGSDSKALAFSGRIGDLSTHPHRLQQPVTIDVATEGAETLELHATLDRTQETSVDQISIEIPNRPQQEIRFGTAETMMVKIPASHSHLKLDLTLVDREVRGLLRIEQRGAKMKVEHVDEQLGGTYVHSLMGASLESIDEWNVEVEISGSLDRPQLELRSTLGPQLSREFNTLVKKVVDDQRQKAEKYVDRQIETQMAKINTVFKDIEELQSTVQEVDREISGIKQSVTRLLGNRTLR